MRSVTKPTASALKRQTQLINDESNDETGTGRQKREREPQNSIGNTEVMAAEPADRICLCDKNFSPFR